METIRTTNATEMRVRRNVTLQEAQITMRLLTEKITAASLPETKLKASSFTLFDLSVCMDTFLTDRKV